MRRFSNLGIGLVGFILLVWLVYLRIIGVAGEFPLNDDWSYALPVKYLLDTGEMRTGFWPAMTLISHVWQGWLVSKIVGYSFVHLRVFSLTMGIGTSLLLYASARRLGATEWAAALATLCLVTNPVFVNLSFTFMTEPDYLFWSTLGLYAMIRATVSPAATRTTGWWLLCGVASAVAFLTRQHGLLLPAAAGLVLLVRAMRQRPIRLPWMEGTAVGLPGLVALIGYQFWKAQTPTPSLGFEKKLAFMFGQSFGEVLFTLYGAWLYLGLFCFALLLVRKKTRPSNRQVQAAAGFAAAVVVLSGVALFYYGAPPQQLISSSPSWNIMPYLGNIVHDTGVGPITTRDALYFRVSPFKRGPYLLWVAVTALTAFGLWKLIAHLLTVRLDRFAAPPPPSPKPPTAAILSLLLAMLTLVEIAISPEKDGGLFDRHVLLLLIPLLLLLAPQVDRLQAWSWRGILAIALLGLTGWFAAAGTHDYVAWNSARWVAIEYLQQTRHATRRDINAGFEYGGLYNSQTLFTNGKLKPGGHLEPLFGWWTSGLPRYNVTYRPPIEGDLVGRVRYVALLPNNPDPYIYISDVSQLR